MSNAKVLGSEDPAACAEPAAKYFGRSPLVLMASVAMLLGAVANFVRPIHPMLASLAIDSTVSIALSLAAVILAKPIRGGVGFTRLYTALFVAFHLGAVWSLTYGGTPGFENTSDAAWFYSSLLPEALALSALFIAIVTTASLVVQVAVDARIQTPRGEGRLRPVRSDAELRTRQFIGQCAGAAAIVSIVAWFAISAASGGLSYGSNYLGYLTSTSGTPLPWVYLLMGVSMGAAGAGTPYAKKTEKAVIGFYFVFAVVAFPLGLRGEVLIPALAFLATRSRAKFSGAYRWTLPLALLGLSAGALVAKTRLGSYQFSFSDLNPLNGLTELGYSLRPLLLTLRWQSSYPGTKSGIETYFNPVARAIDPLGLAGVITARDDPAAFNGFVSRGYGQIGGSILAESYWSGGLTGAVIVAVLVGLILGSADAMPDLPFAEALLGTLMFVLLLWVRNSFTPVPGQAAVCVAFTVGLWLQAQLRELMTMPESYSRHLNVPDVAFKGEQAVNGTTRCE